MLVIADRLILLFIFCESYQLFFNVMVLQSDEWILSLLCDSCSIFFYILLSLLCNSCSIFCYILLFLLCTRQYILSISYCVCCVNSDVYFVYILLFLLCVNRYKEDQTKLRPGLSLQQTTGCVGQGQTKLVVTLC